MAKKTALVLSGGGALGAFEAAVEKYAREQKGYNWDLVAGVSVGSLNAIMVAMEKYDELWKIWNTISNRGVYTGGFNLWSVIKILFGAKSFYGNKPLFRMIQEQYDPTWVKKDLRVGSVSLKSGKYTQFKPGMLNKEEFQRAVLASTAMPTIWAPVQVSADYPDMADGGARQISPLSDVLKEDPDEVIIINCMSEKYTPPKNPTANILQIGLTTLSIFENQVLRGDIRGFLRVNALVKQAAEKGVTLTHPRTGKPYKYFESKVIEPAFDLGDVLDFSQPSVQERIKAGFERAKAVFG